LYEFGLFLLDPAKRVLLRNQRPVPLQLKAFQVLLVLVRNSGQVVARILRSAKLGTIARAQQNPPAGNLADFIGHRADLMDGSEYGDR
jgi:hypothetical protein